MPRRGLYEALVTEELARALDDLEQHLVESRRPVHSAEVADRVALHLSRVVRRVIERQGVANRSEVAAEIGREVVRLLAQRVGDADAVLQERPVAPAELLESIARKRPDGKPESFVRPLTPLLDTTLLTNSRGEPGVGQQLKVEITSADRIDVVMAFIRLTGLRPLLEGLARHCEEGRRLRILTTTYTGSTELRALERLEELGAEVRVSYDTSSTRLHAKAWLLHRESGYSTAFIGSSNLTHSAQVTGLEWNVRVSGARNADVIEKMAAVFDSYWNSGDFEAFDRADFRKRQRIVASKDPGLTLPAVELRAEPFQDRLLELVALSRQRGHHRNLLVSATGTGKTVMAALDYARLRDELPRDRLLFVAHRKEILQQALATFRLALREPSFGELWVDGRSPSEFRHVFASIQSLSSTNAERLEPDAFDMVIVDEFHHAAAPSYERLLGTLEPVELLGLTATPERTDGLDVVTLFGGRIAGELRLWDAIDEQRLTPFAYYGIHDGLDLTEVPWRRGRGYDESALTNLVTANDVWARFVVKSLEDHVDDVRRCRALGFCVSVDHAHFMARVFREAGVEAVAVSGQTDSEERAEALARLRRREINVIFSVDLFNEGVDLPAVDTLLMLRPTESATLFLQQLGRGLRRTRDKTLCTVLDFVANHRREFRFDTKLRALLGCSRKELERQVEDEFPYLPAGCQMSMDPVARRIVLDSVRNALPTQWTGRVQELRRLAASHPDPSLGTFLQETGLELEDVYANNRSWSELREAAGLPVHEPGPDERSLRRALGRLLHINDDQRLDFIGNLADAESGSRVELLSERERRLTRMLTAQLFARGSQVTKDSTLQEGVDALWRHPQVLAELRELGPLLKARVDHLVESLEGRPDVPLQIHASYTRLEILAAFGAGEGARAAAWQTGVRWLEDEAADLLAFTLDKTADSFSPTTRYRDYAISRELIHWESQSITREASPTGQRYQHHQSRGSAVFLFARLKVTDRAFWFLGPAEYVEHRGEKPMAITWRLAQPLPGDLYTAFAAAVA